MQQQKNNISSQSHHQQNKSRYKSLVKKPCAVSPLGKYFHKVKSITDKGQEFQQGQRVNHKQFHHSYKNNSSVIKPLNRHRTTSNHLGEFSVGKDNLDQSHCFLQDVRMKDCHGNKNIDNFAQKVKNKENSDERRHSFSGNFRSKSNSFISTHKNETPSRKKYFVGNIRRRQTEYIAANPQQKPKECNEHEVQKGMTNSDELQNSQQMIKKSWEFPVTLKKNQTYEDVLKTEEMTSQSILTKIEKYVLNLDKKGQSQLNRVLRESLKSTSIYTGKAQHYKNTIGRMIEANKMVSETIKTELVDNLKARRSDQCSDHIGEASEKFNMEACNYLMVGSEQLFSGQMSKQLNQNKKFGEKQISKESINFNNFSVITDSRPESRFERNTEGDNYSCSFKANRTYSNFDFVPNNRYIGKKKFDEMGEITKQFNDEWERTLKHKKTIFNKFRSDLIRKFPQIRKRAYSHMSNHQEQSQSEDQEKQNDIRNENTEKGGVNSLEKQQQEKQRKNIFTAIKSQQTELNEERFQDLETSYAQRPQNREQIQSSYQPNHDKLQLSRSRVFGQRFQKSQQKTKNKFGGHSITVFSESKPITPQLQQQLKQSNFTNLLEFVLKRAYFYSVSRQKITLNNIPFTEKRFYQQKDNPRPGVSFLKYSACYETKRKMRVKSFLREKAQASVLSKNRQNIMQMEQEGTRFYQTLKKCLDDAIEDYLKERKEKKK